MVKGISSVASTQVAAHGISSKPEATNFSSLLAERLDQSSVAFSKHAESRAAERGIAIDETLMTQLNESVEKAQAKGAKNILAFDTNYAFIINVPHNRVVTALTQEEMRDNVFTNIDGAVIL